MVKKYSKEELVTEFKRLGETNFDIQLTEQAKEILSRFPDFPLEHFKQWYLKNYAVVGGECLHKYLCVKDGLMSAPKE